MTTDSFIKAHTGGGLTLRHVTPKISGDAAAIICTTSCRRRGRREKLTWAALVENGEELCDCLDARSAEIWALVDAATATQTADYYADLLVSSTADAGVHHFTGWARCAVAAARYEAENLVSELGETLRSTVARIAAEIAAAPALKQLPPKARYSSFAVTRDPDRKLNLHEEPLYAAGLYAYPAPRRNRGIHTGPLDAEILAMTAAICGDAEPTSDHLAAAVAASS